MRTARVVEYIRGGVRQQTANRQTRAGGSPLTRPHKLGRGRGLAGVLALGLLLGGLAAPAAAQDIEPVHLELTPSSTQLAQCMPYAKLDVTVRLTTATRGFDRFDIRARHLPPDRAFTVFLLEQATSPFGAAEYIGDFSTDASGNAHNTFKLDCPGGFFLHAREREAHADRPQPDRGLVRRPCGRRLLPGFQ